MPRETNTTTHTPGPWLQSHRENVHGMWSTQVYDSAGVTIADLAWYAVVNGNVVTTAREANARLIAAAPELLACLKALVLSAHPSRAEHPAMFRAWQVAHAAIAKAEGTFSTTPNSTPAHDAVRLSHEEPVVSPRGKAAS